MKSLVIRTNAKLLNNFAKLLAMKNHPIVILVFVLCSVNSSLFASSSSYLLGDKFGVTKNYTELISAQQVEQQLLNNIWFKESSKLLFSESGVVSIINNDITESRTWRVEKQEQAIYLKLATSTCGELVYRIEKDGNSLKWIDEKTNITVKIDSTPLAKTDKIVKIHNILVGTWSSSIYPSTVIDDLSGGKERSIISADFKYFLNADGTFSKVISINREQESTINGMWQLSENGAQIILHLQKKDCTYEIMVADIKLLTMDELVLGQALATTDLEKELCRKKKTFFYNKQ